MAAKGAGRGRRAADSDDQYSRANTVAAPWSAHTDDMFYDVSGAGGEDPGAKMPPMPSMIDMQSFTGDDGFAMPSMLGGVAIPPPEWANTMTVMMRNLPNKYTQRMLLAEINHTGFLGTFDFLYLPIDPETNANRGYAFLNFVDAGFAWMFKMSYEGRKMNRFNSNKVVSVTPAALQGFEANYAHYANARVNRGDPAARPLFLREPKSLANGSNGNFQDVSGGSRKMGRRRDRGGAGGSEAGGGGNQVTSSSLKGSKAPSGLPEQDDHLLWSSGPSYYGGSSEKADPMPSQVSPLMQLGFTSRDMYGDQAAAASESSKATMLPKFCPHCGGPIQPMFQFCPHCGGNLDFSSAGSG